MHAGRGPVRRRPTSRQRSRRQLVVDEVRRARRVEELSSDCRLDPSIPTECDHLLEEIPGMAGTKGPPLWVVVTTLQVRHHHLVIAEASAPAIQLEDAVEVLERRVLDRNLVGNAAQERLVGE